MQVTDEVMKYIERQVLPEPGFDVDFSWDSRTGNLAVFISLETRKGSGENGFVIEPHLMMSTANWQKTVDECLQRAMGECRKRQGMQAKPLRGLR